MVANMTNERNNSLFEEEVKKEYLDYMINTKTISEETSRSYNRILLVTSKIEEELGKDLNQFTFEELEDVLRSFEANNRNTVESYGRIISSYLNWSVENGYSKDNVLYDLKPSDFEKYLTNNEVYFTDKQLRRYEERCENAQDSVIIRLLFMGVGGKQMSEIRNLKVEEDIDKKNKRLHLTNTLKADDQGYPIKFTTRWIDVDERTIDLIQGAIDQRTYTKKNGEMVERANIRPYTDLAINDYVIRPSITKTDNLNRPVDRFVIYRRIQTLAESFGVDELNAKFIQRSGMMYHANNEIKDGELTLDDIKIVAERFNIKSYHNLKGIVTEENIRATYPII